MFCKVFYAEQFDAFRRACNCDENYLSSLSRCFKWDSSGGKSGSVFLKTRGKMYLLNIYFNIFFRWQISFEAIVSLGNRSFYKICTFLFRIYVSGILSWSIVLLFYKLFINLFKLPTAMAKIIGFYQIGSRNPHTGKVTKMDVLVTENLFYGRKTSRVYIIFIFTF